MFINKKQRIDIHSDTIITALQKKTENQDLSIKTLRKLAKIANSHSDLPKKEAENIFINNQPIQKNVHSQKVAYELKKVISQVSNEKLRNIIGGFIRNCNASISISARKSEPTNNISQIKFMSTAEFVDAYSNSIGQTIGEGAEAIVVEDNKNNNKVFKIFYDDVENDELINQANSFNLFYGENSAQIISGRAIHMDKIEGTPLSQVKEFPANAANNFISLINEMVAKGCAPSDMSENNFLFDNAKNKFSPVDISTGKDNKVDENGLIYIARYISNKTVD